MISIVYTYFIRHRKMSGRCDSSLTGNTNSILSNIRIRRNRARTRASRLCQCYADHPEDERILPSLTLTNDSSFGDFIVIIDDIHITVR